MQPGSHGKCDIFLSLWSEGLGFLLLTKQNYGIRPSCFVHPRSPHFYERTREQWSGPDSGSFLMYTQHILTHTHTHLLSRTYTPTRRVHAIWPSSSCRSHLPGPRVLVHTGPPLPLCRPHNPALRTSHHPSQRLDHLPRASKPLLALLLLPADGTLTMHQRDCSPPAPPPHIWAEPKVALWAPRGLSLFGMLAVYASPALCL